MEKMEQKKPLFSVEKIKQAQELIMPYSEYIKLGKLNFPDHFFVEGKGKKILFYEATHSFDSKNEQFSIIPKLMDEFSPDVVFVENQYPLADGASEKNHNDYIDSIKNNPENNIIKKYGEPRYTVCEAMKRNISFISPESDTETHLKKTCIRRFSIGRNNPVK